MTSPAVTAGRVFALLVLTELADHATDDDVTILCDDAAGPDGSVAAVCVWPRHVAHAADLLSGTGVRVATVVNFPNGDEHAADVVNMTEQALGDGADEIQLVLPYGALLADDLQAASTMLDAVRSMVPTDGHLFTVILETGELATAAHIEIAGRLAIAHGADCIMTSTGTTPVGATLAATIIMLRLVHEATHPVGLVVSGGLSTLADVAAYLDQADDTMGPEWASPTTFRFGANGLLLALISAESTEAC
jgi:deoxyribose-phosphate aldolase